MGVSDWFRRVLGRSREWQWSLDEPPRVVRPATQRVVYPSDTGGADEGGPEEEVAGPEEEVAGPEEEVAGKVMLWFEEGSPVALDDADPQVGQFQRVAERMMKPSLRYRLMGGRR
jgi:hypothetical protein